MGELTKDLEEKISKFLVVPSEDLATNAKGSIQIYKVGKNGGGDHGSQISGQNSHTFNFETASV